MGEFTLGDYVLMEISLAQFFKDLDISMEAGQQVQQLIGKIEISIGKLTKAATAQGGEKLHLPDKPEVKA